MAQSSKSYLNYHRKRKDEGATVILDQSPELPRKPVSDALLVEMIGRLDPDYVVLPNADFSASRTINRSLRFLDNYRRLHGTQYIGMLQGTTIIELDQCYQHLRPLVAAIGLPSSTEKVMPREEIIEALDIAEPTVFFEIHKDPMEEIPESDNVFAFVTSWPVRLGVEMRTLDEYEPTPKPLDFDLDNLSHQHKGMVKRNIGEFLTRMGSPK